MVHTNGKRNTSRFGHMAESFVISELIRRGFNVSLPFNSCRYDIVVEFSGRFRRIQVKYIGKETQRNTIPIVLHSISRNGRLKYTKDEIDFVIAYFEPRQCFYIIPVQDWGNKTVLNLRIGKTKNNQVKRITPMSLYEEKWDLLRN